MVVSAGAAPDRIRFGILGPLEVRTADGRLAPLTAAKPRALLSLLLLNANRAVPTDRLVQALWPSEPPRSAPAAVRTYLSTLRQVLGRAGEDGPPRLVRRPPGYLIEVAPADLDSLVFADLMERARRAAGREDQATAADLLGRALALWRGRPLDGVDLGPAADGDLVDLIERHVVAVEEWAQAKLTLGEPAQVLPVLLAAVADQPPREKLRGLAMLALYRSGRPGEALAAYRALRRQLIAELGIEPSPPLQGLHRQILAADPVLDRLDHQIWNRSDTGVRAPDRPPQPPRQLPPDIVSFTGRDRELATIEAALSRRGGHHQPGTSSPLVIAVDGAGGVGKSALAVHLAHRLAGRFPGGQPYVDLRGATPGARPLDPFEVLGRFLRALGANGAEPASEAEAAATFRSLVASRKVLLVLDNASDARQVRPLLPADPASAVLLTSRRVLATLDNALRLRLDVLPEADALVLLTRLAGDGRVDADPEAAREVVRRCAGLPLALRIAGGRLAARPGWPVRVLAEKLRDADRRLDELRIADLAVRPSLEIGYRLLRESAEPDERAAATAYPFLGLFDGADLSVSAAAALLGTLDRDAERWLERLVDARLLESPAPGRYRLHDLLRIFARDLAQREPSTATHAALHRLFGWYVATTWRGFQVLRPADSRPAPALAVAAEAPPFADADAALRWLERERANLVVAVCQAAGTAVGEHAAVAPQLARALFAFFHVRGYLRDWIKVNEIALAVARRTGDELGQAFACRDLGAAHETRGQYRRAQRYLEEGLARYTGIGDRPGRAACLNGLGLVHDSLGELPAAVARLEQALALSQELGDRHSQGISLNNLGGVYLKLGWADRAVDVSVRALEIFRRTGNRRSQGASLTHLGQAHHRLGDRSAALASCEEGLAIFRELGDRRGEAETLIGIAGVHRESGEVSAAVECLSAARSAAAEAGDDSLLATCIRELDALGDRPWERAHDSG
nr:BTAD domain-containing putative transcriptional regulator [Micromonospora sp. DSM 115978]